MSKQYLAATLLVIFACVGSSLQDIEDNNVETEDNNPLADAAAAILKEQNAESIGGLVNNLMQNGGAKELGSMLMNAAGSENAGQLLQGLGSMLGGGEQGLDPNLLGAAMNLLSQNTPKDKKSQQEGFDINSLISVAGSFLGKPGNAQSLMEYFPMVLQTVNSFFGPEADARAKTHSDHAWLLPPIVEKLHIMFDHFMNSELGKTMVNVVGAEKFVKIFEDENNKFSYRKFVEMMENHSFRRHWIKMVTDRIALAVQYLSDPKIQKKYLNSGQYFLNSILRSTGYPKTTFFDPNRPTETLTALVNHFLKTTLNLKISSKQYVKPAVEYAKELFRLSQNKGTLVGSALDSRQLSDKLTDTINLEVIEPIARVNRAYRFATKHTECDRYVLCLVNQGLEDKGDSLPGLRPLLSRGTSVILGWFLSGQTGTPFWSYYNLIMEDNNCKGFYKDTCNDFHIEEIKVTTEYVHNEL